MTALAASHPAKQSAAVAPQRERHRERNHGIARDDAHEVVLAEVRPQRAAGEGDRATQRADEDRPGTVRASGRARPRSVARQRREEARRSRRALIGSSLRMVPSRPSELRPRFAGLRAETAGSFRSAGKAPLHLIERSRGIAAGWHTPCQDRRATCATEREQILRQIEQQRATLLELEAQLLESRGAAASASLRLAAEGLLPHLLRRRRPADRHPRQPDELPLQRARLAPPRAGSAALPARLRHGLPRARRRWSPTTSTSSCWSRWCTSRSARSPGRCSTCWSTSSCPTVPRCRSVSACSTAC